MKRSNGAPYRGRSGSSRVIFIAAMISASLALGATVAGVSSFKPYDPEGPPDPACPMGYHFKDGECVLITPPTDCQPGYHLEGEVCQPDAPPSCPDGYLYSEGRCVPQQPPEPEPTPQPDPEPEPQPEPGTAEIPFGDLHGVNYFDPVLNRKEDKPKLPIQRDLVEKFVPIAKDAGFNVFRIPVNWESYVGNEAAFLGQLVALVEEANSHDIYVWIDFHQFYATSNWGSRVANGNGLPDFVVSCYNPRTEYEHDPEVRTFWHDYYTNNVRDSTNSCKNTLDVWTLHARFMKKMIDEVDHYPNVIGYEILNEPHVWKDADYDNLGKMHTEIAKKLRTSTDKLIIFTRETAHGRNSDGSDYTRKVALEYKILPKDPAKNVMYIPHLYNLNEIETHVERWKEVQQQWKTMGYNVSIGVGEWSPQPPQLPTSFSVTQQNMDAFVEVWSREGWMHTYWAYGGFNFGEGNVLVKQGGYLTRAGEYYKESIETFYE